MSKILASNIEIFPKDIFLGFDKVGHRKYEKTRDCKIIITLEARDIDIEKLTFETLNNFATEYLNK